MTEYICAGFGGQGVLVAGLILADAGMEQGKNITWFPSYGAEMRGGTANCHVKISDEEIASPYATHLNVLIAMNEASIDKLQDKIMPGGVLVYNSTLVKADKKLREDITQVAVDATNIAADMENVRGTNIVMLGALTRADDTFSAEYLIKAVDNYFSKKGKNNPKNAMCFKKGEEAAVVVPFVR